MVGVLAVGAIAIALFASAGQAAGPPSIAFTPASVSFGSVPSGSSSQTITLKNTGGSASSALSISLSGSPAFTIAADGCTGTSLGPSKSCTVKVTYAPTTSGSTDAATLTATAIKPAATASATLTGNSFTSFSQVTCSGVNCAVSSSTNTSSVNVAATGTSSSSGTLQAGIYTGTLGCTYEPSNLHLDPNTFFVLSSSTSYSKKVTIQYPAGPAAPPLDLSDNDPGSAPAGDGDADFDDVKWISQVCFQAPYPFTTRAGTPASGPDAQGFFTGLLPNCPASGPCVDRAASTTTNINSGAGTYDVLLVVDIPAGEPGDPRMN